MLKLAMANERKFGPPHNLKRYRYNCSQPGDNIFINKYTSFLTMLVDILPVWCQ